MAQPGFMIYYDDWREFAEDYSDEELGQILRALFSYFDAHKETAFSDRGMRQFFRQATRSMDRNTERYADRCRKNAYNRYLGKCKQENTEPLSFEAWSTGVDDRRPSSPTITETVTVTEAETVTETVTEAVTETENKTVTPSTNESSARGFPEVYRPLSEDEFEKRREAALASLRAASQRFPQEMPKKGRPPYVSG